MRLLGDKVFIRFTKENRDSIFSKEVTKQDGSKIKLFINVDADDIDERKAGLFVQTGIVEAVAPNVKNILVGDVAIVDYMLCNDASRLVFEEENGDTIYWANANTKYHEYDEVIPASRRTGHDTVLARAGDIDVLSSIYGIIRGNQLIARSPFVFLQHEENVVQKVTGMKIVYNDAQKHFSRKVLACGQESTEKYGIRPDQSFVVFDIDIFSLKLNDRKIDCVMDMDVVGKKHLAV